ncbi:S-acyltransferase protein [Corchorus olitorius]|uniref:S-acyltransferase protein n=1 Tax=Corchorus olitorius TaxID=93759 RepID=A0A1R3HQX2_9ROSI|nr:S-acyltransferase protein [Corchorus olitorius]
MEEKKLGLERGEMKDRIGGCVTVLGRCFVFVELCGLLIWEDKAQGIMSWPW